MWFCTWPSEFDQPEMKALQSMNQFLARNVRYFRNTRSEAEVAVVWSDLAASFYSTEAELMEGQRAGKDSGARNTETEFTGITDALIRGHIPIDVLDDVSLEREDLSRYHALVLPNVACMSGVAAGRIRDYVRSGGTVFATFETSRYDQYGIERRELALSDLFGVTSTGAIGGPKRWDYMKEVAPSPILAGLHRAFLPAAIFHLSVRPAGSRALLQFTQPLAGRYDGIPGLSGDSALVVNRFGKGTAIYFAGDLGATIHGWRQNELLQLVQNAVRTLAPPTVGLENAPASMEVVLRSQANGKRYMLHLLNYTGEMTRPIRHVIPLTNVRISLAWPRGTPKAVSLLRSASLTVERTAPDRVSFVMPRIDEYEAVVIE